MVKTEEEKELSAVTRKLRKAAWSAAKDYNMIEAGDRIMVCLSGGKDSYTRVMPVQQSGSLTFFTRTERVRTTININGETRRLEYNINPNANVICGTDTLNIATVNNLPLGPLTYYVTRSGQTRERTIEIDEACQLVEL